MALCPRCGVRVVYRYGMCAGCAKAAIAAGEIEPAPKCKDCRKYAQRSRGLCHLCFDDPATRARYPDGREANGGKENDMSMEEVEALIAEQMRPENLPAWWPKDGVRDVDPEGDE
mgnify:FL=1